jgi:hypothetical protein
VVCSAGPGDPRGGSEVSLRDRWKYTRIRPKNTATYTRYRNWLSTRYHARGNGKRPLPDRVSRAVASRTPGYRNRINPATGRPRWTDRNDQALGRWRTDIASRTRQARELQVTNSGRHPLRERTRSHARPAPSRSRSRTR